MNGVTEKSWGDYQMKNYRVLRGVYILALCAGMTLFNPSKALADSIQVSGAELESGRYAAVVKESADIYVSMDSYDILKTASGGESFDILHDAGGGWMEVRAGDRTGVLSIQDVEIREKDSAAAAAAAQSQAEADPESSGSGAEDSESSGSEAETFRQGIVNFAKQFLGCPYSYGGNDPHYGVDCSGFVRYVMQHAAGVVLQRSSRAQATQGCAVSADQMRPGDLIFYGSGSGINHVAMYAGDGQVVHASTYKTGVKMSVWNYRTPLRIVNVLGD